MKITKKVIRAHILSWKRKSLSKTDRNAKTEIDEAKKLRCPHERFNKLKYVYHDLVDPSIYIRSKNTTKENCDDIYNGLVQAVETILLYMNPVSQMEVISNLTFPYELGSLKKWIEYTDGKYNEIEECMKENIEKLSSISDISKYPWMCDVLSGFVDLSDFLYEEDFIEKIERLV